MGCGVWGESATDSLSPRGCGSRRAFCTISCWPTRRHDTESAPTLMCLRDAMLWARCAATSARLGGDRTAKTQTHGHTQISTKNPMCTKTILQCTTTQLHYINQTFTELSEEPDARRPPLGSKDTERTGLLWPCRVATHSPVDTSQIFTELSKEPDARRPPLGSKDTDSTELLWPCMFIIMATVAT